ncbi:MAG: ABC transporter ATP-binding protein [Candidatus Bathyarchaeota archaeon]|nr:MAG: ABC transporter ATP-binding protein [Candidatus Bathyarchaeota archaeon]
MEENTVLDVKNLKKYFMVKMGFLKSLLSKEQLYVRAVDGVSFRIGEREIFGLVGESGCGKTTTGRSILRLIEPTSGQVNFKGSDLIKLDPTEMRNMRRRLQIIFQDPYESLNPRMSIYDILAEPLQLQHIAEGPDEIIGLETKVLGEMGLVPPEEFLYRFPHELSGGQRQRVAVARAFIMTPEFVVADEPVSMLDASMRTEVVELILGMVQKLACAFLYITHDIALTRYICNRVGVMYLGQIVELGLTEDIVHHPHHPYTEALLAAVPVPDPTARRREIVIKGEVANPINPPPGCRFHPRCPYAKGRCGKEEPKLSPSGKGRTVACHFPLE